MLSYVSECVVFRDYFVSMRRGLLPGFSDVCRVCMLAGQDGSNWYQCWFECWLAFNYSLLD